MSIPKGITAEMWASFSEEQKAAIAAVAPSPKKRGLSCKVSAKGAVSVYGLGRWPVTLYASQWARLFEFVDEIKAFIESNKSSLALREED